MEICKNLEEIEDIAYNLNTLSRSFYETGNNYIGDELCNIHVYLIKKSESIRSLVNSITDDMVKQSWQNSDNVFNAALAGIKISEESKNNE